MNIQNQTKMRCVNPINTKLTRNKTYYGRLFRTRNGQLTPTSSYNQATFFVTKNEEGRTVRLHALRFMPA